MIAMAYRHGLRASELADLRWDQIDFAAATLAAQGQAWIAEHAPDSGGDELRATLRRLQQ